MFILNEFAVTSPTGTSPTIESDEFWDISNESRESVTSLTSLADISIIPRYPPEVSIELICNFNPLRFTPSDTVAGSVVDHEVPL